ncbi:MAG: copper chaperone PCu(A)C [Rhodothermaeota bacterium MED-G64]|nr:MAG: copper chaperone PCu(A)C [Rhodothermaeota bacterium MED-G64]RPF80603.1 MAG: copper chaperone PCu(A)C [Rhodothermaceae bacterium TMED105]|tara:strand:- start:7138 stop:7656 length:519 start_codon:yes stop_codon:yes gene_type:complete
MKFFTTKAFFALFFSAVVLLSACQPSDSEMNKNPKMAPSTPEVAELTATITDDAFVVDGAWARVGMQGGMSAAYFTISNGLDQDDVLLGATSSVAQATEVHETYDAGEGMMGMRERESLPIAANSLTEFRQGGLHVMFLRLTEELSEGDEVQFTLEFENAGDVTVTAPVRMR